MRVRMPTLAVLPCLVLLLAFLRPLAAQNSAATNTSRQPLWKIKGKQATVYLLGSVHVLKKEHYPLAAPIEEAFKKSEIAVFETDLEAEEDPDRKAKLLRAASLPENETLQGQVAPKIYERLTACLKEAGVSPEAFGKLRPGAVALTLYYFEAQKLGLDERLGVDRHFHARARRDDKEIIALETAESKMKVVAGLSKQDAEGFLDTSLKEVSVLKDKVGEMANAWRTGDAKLLAGLINAALEEHPWLYQRLIVERNRNWVPKIEKLLRGDRDAIVIVGAGHLAGKDSIIEMLGKDGFRAEQQ
jgi:uncharacterized protein YbaP (TraB family)